MHLRMTWPGRVHESPRLGRGGQHGARRDAEGSG